jgi:hypothetical protein
MSTTGASTSSAFSLLLEIPIQMSGGEARFLPALPPLGLPPLKGCWMEVCDARKCSIGVALSSKGGRRLRQHSSQDVPSPPLAPILRCKLSQIVGGWHTGRRRCDGWGGYSSALVDLASTLFSCGLFFTSVDCNLCVLCVVFSVSALYFFTSVDFNICVLWVVFSVSALYLLRYACNFLM